MEKLSSKDKQLLFILEKVLLAIFLSLLFWLVWHRWGEALGYDVSKHLNRLKDFSWDKINPCVHCTPYGYHPPLAFILTSFSVQLGLNIVQSAQIISLVSVIVTFAAFRLIFKELGLLYTIIGLGSLYFGIAIPLQVYLIHSINIDAILLAFSSIAILLSIKIFWGDNAKSLQILLYSSALIFVLTLSMFTKFTGLILCGIPILTLMSHSQSRRRLKLIKIAIIISVAPILISFPYYYSRYYVAYGSFLPDNATFYDSQNLKKSEQFRDANRIQFILQLFLPSDKHREYGLEARSNGNRFRHLSDTWSDFWVRASSSLDKHNQPSQLSRQISYIYWYIFTALFWIGFLTWLLRYSGSQDNLSKLGLLFALFGIVQILAHAYFTYNTRHFSKAMYIAISIWGISYFVIWGLYVIIFEFMPSLADQMNNSRVQFVMFFVVIFSFLILNYTIPIY